MRGKSLAWAAAGLCLAAGSARAENPKLDDEIARLTTVGKIPGVAVAVIENGKVAHVTAMGVRNQKGDPLTPQTVMYAASLTKTTFAYYVMMLVDEGKLDLDKPIAETLPKPLPDYKAYADLAADPRWRKITPRMLLTHSAGFPNFRWLNPDEKLDIKFEPGSRYAYSGEGLNLMQFVIEQGLGLKVGEDMDRRLFKPLGMSRSGMVWRDDFATDLADGRQADGKWEGHDDRSSVKAAGSLDTTIDDMGKLAAAMAGGWGLSKKARAEFSRGSLAIPAAYQFPPFTEDKNPDNARIKLAAGVGVVTFDGPQGHAFFKGGHNDITDNMLVCVEKRRRCVVVLTNAGDGQRIIPSIVKAALGETGLPWGWEYTRLLPVEAP
ncbi:serine hydrolase [Caulobacter sp. D4A]|uniref:serine hydrolase domain-containing protein n=1 Tax=unclassified Caulobacter TaxID=2648921 RepID=UPI000D73F74B|nr:MULTISPECIES: serine hydrolase domain-containing protein [unclassified Caulobacter]PXA78103.1 serine hydrolase [Caulobacter sp. D4A]PXA92733.1 serine hydrolase [Caulobacter sp. D5]